MKDYDINELLEYRVSHSLKETAEYYETTTNYINSLCFKHRGYIRDEQYYNFCSKHTVEEIMKKYFVSERTAISDKRKANIQNINPKKLYEYYSTHTINETAKHFDISITSMYFILKSNGYEPPRHKNYDNFDIEAFKEYSKDHKIKEIAAHFNISYANARWSLEKYGCSHKRKNYLRFKQAGKNVYILKKDDEELCFPRTEDIAKYFDRTKTHIIVTMNETGELFGYKVRKARMIYYP